LNKSKEGRCWGTMLCIVQQKLIAAEKGLYNRWREGWGDRSRNEWVLVQYEARVKKVQRMKERIWFHEMGGKGWRSK
jgi:hypothetical protein